MKYFIGLILVAVIASAAVFIAMGGLSNVPAPVQKDGVMRTEADFRNKVAELRRDQQRVKNSIERLKKQKAKTVAFLKEKGITDSSKITNDSDVKYALNNLRHWKTDIEKLETQVGKYDGAINGILAMLDKLERDRINKEVALSEDQLVELRAIVIDLDQRLDISDNDIFKDEEMANLLDEEMGVDKKPSKQDEIDELLK